MVWCVGGECVCDMVMWCVGGGVCDDVMCVCGRPMGVVYKGQGEHLLMCSFPPVIPSVSGPGNTVTPGTKFNLTCNVGTGYSTSVVWSKDGSTSLPMSSMASGNVLIFTNPQPADTGKYTCSFMGSNGPVSEAFVVSIECECVCVCV